MRQAHGPAEKLFVDFAGDTVPVFDAATGAQRLAHVFVAVLGASNYTYAEARWSEGLADWIGLHVNTFTAIGGVPKAVVCDNLKAGVTATCRYEPGINRTYQELAEHYGTAILPTRPRKPRDKAGARWRELRGLGRRTAECLVVARRSAARASDRQSVRCLLQSRPECAGRSDSSIRGSLRSLRYDADPQQSRHRP